MRNRVSSSSMADYYPLIARAVAGLEKNSGENRRALYERARAALLAQLRSVEPALDESDITRERLALEESIRKVEAEAARKFIETPSRPAAAPQNPSDRSPTRRPCGRTICAGATLRQSAAHSAKAPSRPGKSRQHVRARPSLRPRGQSRRHCRLPSRCRSRRRKHRAPRRGGRSKVARSRGASSPGASIQGASSPGASSPHLQSGAMQLRHPLRRPTADRASPGDGKEARNFDTDELGAPLARADRSPRNSYPPPIVDLDRSPRARERDRRARS